jgi:hypothetical protein
MPCIILQADNGSQRSIIEGAPYKLDLGEKVIGIDPECGGTVIHANQPPPANSLHDELAAEVGSGFGDWIRAIAGPIAAVTGKRGCTTCEARRIVTNAYGRLKEQHGQFKALSMIKDLWALSMRASGNDVLMKLRELLDDKSRD